MVEGSHNVLIRGHLFDYAEKAPFVPSGVSILGAVEYDSERDLVRCHECGEWFQSVLAHAGRVHSITAVEYKQKHGLRLRTSVVGLRLKAAISTAITESNSKPTSRFKQYLNSASKRIAAPPATANLVARKAPRLHHEHNWEKKNQDGRCRAQTLFRIQTLAAQLGRTPTVAEMDEHGLNHCSLRQLFDGVSTNQIIEMAGLTPNQRGQSREGYSADHLLATLRDFYAETGRVPRPVDLSERQLPSFGAFRRCFGSMKNAYRDADIPKSAWPDLDERMPWPADYTVVQPMAQRGA